MLAAIAAALSLGLVACGDDDETASTGTVPDTTTSTTTAPSTTQSTTAPSITATTTAPTTATTTATTAVAGPPVTVLDARIEDLPPQSADVISARALAPLATLLGMTEKHRRPEGTGLFPKGATVQNEIAEAARHWRFNHKIHTSLTDPQAAIVEIGAIDRA